MVLTKYASLLKSKYTTILTKDNKKYRGKIRKIDLNTNILITEVELKYKNMVSKFNEVFIKGSNIRYFTVDYSVIKRRPPKLNKR
ncbi:hypothetical protein TUBRATIS_000290 [Tubulinosema ratisbonensis]|uniref:Sm domain-containing protein n=1 Tax=Tubulinosema ratisbonensis TaxID=291195 RepID=A0A437AQB3_9MICR|nr:hypothetical protein TUBRATIS_000290 [Tubulinosema ratisbonensis]